MMLNSYAERIRFVRTLTNLSREAFENKYGINRNTLKSWELGINALTEKSAMQIADAIQNEGFSCSPEWLIFGRGVEPRAFETDNKLLNSISEQSKIIYEAEYFKKNNDNSIVTMITDLSTLPIYQIGDYVGGIIEGNIRDSGNFKKFINRICIISLINETLIIRKVIKANKDLIVLCAINEEFEADVVTINDIHTIACVIWHRSTFEENTNDY
jgi:transcriptional regulator with XRE-family HTH domain